MGKAGIVIIIIIEVNTLCNARLSIIHVVIITHNNYTKKGTGVLNKLF